MSSMSFTGFVADGARARRVLTALAAPTAILALPPTGEASVLARRGGRVARVLTCDAAILAGLRAHDLIEEVRPRSAPPSAGEAAGRERARRFKISDRGRMALRRAAASDAGLSEDAAFAAQQRDLRYVRPADGASDGASPPASGDAPARRVALNQRESPLAWLARRKGANGAPFLSPEELAAGDRLRADFEAAQMGPRIAQNWDRFRAVVDEGARGPGDGLSDRPAADRVRRAVAALGPDLADVAVRVCCCLEGLERVETALGWSARSGKVVLKIALGRLVSHYGLRAEGAARGRIEAWRGD